MLILEYLLLAFLVVCAISVSFSRNLLKALQAGRVDVDLPANAAAVAARACNALKIRVTFGSHQLHQSRQPFASRKSI